MPKRRPGSGTCARVATLTDRGLLPVGAELVHDSIVGSRFGAVVRERVHEHGRDAVVPVVTGAAYRVGECHFDVDPDDTLVPGFVLR